MKRPAKRDGPKGNDDGPHPHGGRRRDVDTVERAVGEEAKRTALMVVLVAIRRMGIVDRGMEGVAGGDASQQEQPEREQRSENPQHGRRLRPQAVTGDLQIDCK